MHETIKAPRLNTNDSEVVVTRWLLPAETRVDAGTVLGEIETTKATAEITAEGAGWFHPAVAAGTSVPVGAVIAWLLDRPDATPPALAPQGKPEQRPLPSGGTLVSEKAQGAMERHGLTLGDFPGLRLIREADVLRRAAELAGGGRTTDHGSPLPPHRVFSETDLLVYGTGSLGLVAADAAGAVATGFLDFAPSAPELAGLPVYHDRHLDDLVARGLRRVHLCLPEERMEAAIERCRALGLVLAPVIHPTACVAASASYGENIFLGPGTILGPLARLGDFSRLFNAASVAHHSVIGHHCRITDGARIAGSVRIGDRVLVGIGATVALRLSIGDDAILVSGSHAHDDVPSRHVLRADGRAHPRPDLHPSAGRTRS